ncbi:ATP-binding protein [Streptomyces sp. H10-C2]|uniref:ATP-binding protein n=1 Tax=unclassified Streptomyces TaxID=2593676 RepID=UPI0024B99A0E|nr:MULTISPECIES: ATP-binding protein [unclassified Streptomyces]MDJ0344082.1 ATP-binding protein [Streptomyces sp. PH10-H1]MDJ0368621.1 ATP-binding protein [Streptomyces sp. H10-C2]
MILMDSETGDTAEARDATALFVARVCPWADLDAVVLVVSELVTNAVRHTTGWWQLSVDGRRDRLTVRVDDSSHTPPTARIPDLSGGGGLGWTVVRALTTTVEVVQRPGGKAVRAQWWRPAAGTAAG